MLAIGVPRHERIATAIVADHQAAVLKQDIELWSMAQSVRRGRGVRRSLHAQAIAGRSGPDAD